MVSGRSRAARSARRSSAAAAAASLRRSRRAGAPPAPEQHRGRGPLGGRHRAGVPRKTRSRSGASLESAGHRGHGSSTYLRRQARAGKSVLAGSPKPPAADRRGSARRRSTTACRLSGPDMAGRAGRLGDAGQHAPGEHHHEQRDECDPNEHTFAMLQNVCSDVKLPFRPPVRSSRGAVPSAARSGSRD